MAIKIGSLIASRYEVKKEIGSGGASNVFEAYDQINKINVAIKLFKNKVDEDDSIYKDFMNECIILSNFNNENIVSIYDSGIYNGYPYIINELIKGNSLKDLLDKRSYLTIEESLDVMIQLLKALSYAHFHKCVHKDVKPNNIYIQNDGTIKLGDFGISEFMHSEENTERKMVGTVQYCAPEIFQGHKATVLSDIYACGILFYELLTGKVPFEENSVKETALAHIKKKFPSIKNVLKTCPKKLEKIVLKCVEKNPKKRYQNCEDLLEKLIEFKTEFAKEKM